METKLDFGTRRLFRHVLPSQMPLIWSSLKSSVEPKQGERRSQSENDTLPLKWLPYLRFAFLMVCGFTMAIFGDSVLSKPMVAPVDPFSAYVDIFPGQSVSAVHARGFVCRSAYNFDRDPMEGVCTFTPAADIVSNIYAMILFSLS